VCGRARGASEFVDGEQMRGPSLRGHRGILAVATESSTADPGMRNTAKHRVQLLRRVGGKRLFGAPARRAPTVSLASLASLSLPARGPHNLVHAEVLAVLRDRQQQIARIVEAQVSEGRRVCLELGDDLLGQDVPRLG
jgi:hypothetical protein